LRDLRVIRAILHFGALALAKARAEAIENLRELGEDKEETWLWSYWDRHAFTRLRLALEKIEPHARRMERVCESGRIGVSEAPRSNRIADSPKQRTGRLSL
jgi:hypothetical protein